MSPVLQSVRRDTGCDIVTTDGQFFTQVETETEFINGGLTSANLLGRGGGCEPGGQGLPSARSPRGTQQGKHRARAKQVEVSGIRMPGPLTLLQEFVPGLSALNPTLFKPGQALGVKRHTPLGSQPPVFHPLVVEHQSDKTDHTRQQPAPRQGAGPQEKPRNSTAGKKEQKPRVAYCAVSLRTVAELAFALTQPVSIHGLRVRGPRVVFSIPRQVGRHYSIVLFT